MRRLVLPAVLVAVLALVLALVLSRGGGDLSASSRARTIVLVTVDTLRRDRVGVYGRNAITRTPLTPRMDALAARGLRFDDARTPVPLTLPGHTTMLAGLPPAATGVRVNAYGRIPSREARGFVLLPEVLGEAGYETGAFVSAAVMLATYGLDSGFDRYDDSGLDEQAPGPSYRQRDGEQTVANALTWVAARDASAHVFLWVHLFEPHAPYAQHLPRSTPTEVRYDADVARSDRIVGQLLDGLEAAGRGDAAVLLTADHGEALGEHGELTHGYLLGDAVLRVPFLLAAPGIAPGVRKDPVDLADVAPTLAHLAGATWPVTTPATPGRGIDLLAGPASADRPRVAESLFAHQRFRWAQLAAAVTPDGALLVDAGGERILWLAPAPAFEPQAGPLPATSERVQPDALASLSAVLRAYRDGERRDLVHGGGAAGGYGSGSSASPFLAPQDNGALRNPYDQIPGVIALDVEADRLRKGTPPKAILARLERMALSDPGNPELLWWIGRAHERAAVVALDRSRDAEAREARRAAAQAYLQAWRAGRQDANTLGRLVGVDAEGREADALALLHELQAEIPPDCLLALLEARLLRALGQDDDADAACARAHDLCQSVWQRARLERARADSTCR